MYSHLERWLVRVGLEEYNKCFEQLYSLVAKVIDVITSPRQEEE